MAMDLPVLAFTPELAAPHNFLKVQVDEVRAEFVRPDKAGAGT
jgi:hypothetical protein